MQSRHRKKLPTIWLMTDERVEEPTLLAAVARLPKGLAGIIFRHYRTAPVERRALFNRVRRIAQRNRLCLLLGGTAAQAQSWGADGWHGRDARPASRPMVHSMAAHDEREMRAARRCKADLVFLSPLFPTRSHPGAPALGRLGFSQVARLSSAPVIALGGVRASHQRILQSIGASGWAAIDGLTR